MRRIRCNYFTDIDSALNAAQELTKHRGTVYVVPSLIGYQLFKKQPKPHHDCHNYYLVDSNDITLHEVIK